MPGSRRIPDCGKATTCTSARAACASRAASTPSRRSSPLSVSTWAWLRTAVAPEAIVAPSVRVARSSTEPPAVRQFCAIVADQPGQPRLGGVGTERQAETGRIEMGVDVGERREQHTAAAVGDRHPGRRWPAGDAAVADHHVHGASARLAWPRSNVPQQQIPHLGECSALRPSGAELPG